METRKPIVHQITDITTQSVGRISENTMFYSEWDENLNLISMKVDGVEMCDGHGGLKPTTSYNKAKAAKGRHLKELKQKLGLKKESEKNTRKILVKQYYDFKFKPAEIEVGAKMFGNQRVSSIFIFEDTEENRILAREHNDLIDKKEEIEQKIREITNKMKK
ncbi:MAG: hypothetical protein E6Q36_05355 [Chryseobacterium sp.]|nr:MAG: hypothetical protein E6Q36_05355 [Chryseobacterium sp.]